MASTEKPSDIIQKARKKLTEALLQIEPDLILAVVDSHLLLTQAEYFSLSLMKDPHGLLQNLVDTVLRKGESAHEQFLDCLENLRQAFPSSLCAISEYLENGPADLRHETEIQTAVLLVNGAETSGVAMSPAGSNEVESLDPSVSPEAGKEVEKAGAGSGPSGTGSKAEKPGDVLSSPQGDGGKNQDATEDGDATEESDVSPMCPERDFRHESQIQSTAMLLMTGAEELSVAMSPAGGNEVESLDPSQRQEREKPDVGTAPSGTGSKAENPDVGLCSIQGDGVKNHDTTEDRDGAEEPDVAPVCPERGPVNTTNKLHISSNTVFWGEGCIAENTAQNLDSGTPFRVPQERVVDENLDPSASAGARKDVEKPGTPLPSGNGSGVKNLDAVDDGNGVETHSAAAACPQGGNQAENLEISVSLEAASRDESPNVPFHSRAESGVEPLSTSVSKGKEGGANGPDASGRQSGAMSPAGRERTESSNHGPVDLKHETQVQSTTVLLMSGAEKSGVAMSPVEGNESESLDPSVSSEAEKEVEKADAGTVPSGTGSKAENQDVVLSSPQGDGVENQDATGGDGMEKPATAPVCPERATKPFSLSTKEDFARVLHTTNSSGSTSAEERSCSAEQNLEGNFSPGPSPQGLVDTLMMSANEVIRKGRKQLIEILEKDLDLILDELVSESVITEEEYEAFNKMEGDSRKSRKLLLLIQKKGETACCQFLEHLEITCPGSNQVLQCSIHCCSSLEQKAELQQELDQEEKHSSKGCSSPEQGLEQEEKHPAKERRKALKDVLRKLKLQKKKSKKFSLQEVLEISSGSLKECIPSAMGDLPWHFLRKVLALNVTARSTSLEKEAVDCQRTREEEEEKKIDGSIFFNSRMDERVSVNPLDVLCAVLLCSDSFLQQEILSKMSTCQFALPLLLPLLETSRCTLMLWAMRDIVKKWRPHSLADSRGFREESLVLTSMPTISFVRMGSLSLSKSRFMNEFLSPSQQHHDFFLHRDMECGNIPREIADGLVEIAWYFPGGQKSLDLFPEPVAVANLRGDVESHWVQFSFLSEISSAVFIFAEHIGEREYALLSSLKESSTKYYFILESHGKVNETLNFLNKLAPVLNLSNSHILAKDGTTNAAEFVEQLRSIIGRIINPPLKTMSIQEMATVAHELTIQVDEDIRECQDARKCAVEITGDVRDTAIYKKEMLKLQGDLWKNLAKVEKEFCRMERQGETPSEKYRSQQRNKLMALREQQNKCELTIGLINFIHGIKHSQSAEKHYLKWIKFNLDHIARANLSKLRAEYKEKCKSLGGEVQKIAEVDQLISSSSLGVEHFMRELGQFYEAECLMFREGKISKTRRQFAHFPSIAADLMLEGFPLELIDGDASNIPLQWITDVLTKLNNKLRRQSKMFVITVLGVQSTGKSTLLNTMFGLQFAVSSGRCTRGAFMTLLKVRENLIPELGCDFILVIDTEGLKAPELAKLEDSYQHDNELATLVIGLSDVTIVNMSMENATEMKDILQIVAHAFLRMEKIGQRPNCQFVHQNVSDVSAHDQNMRDRKHLLEQLNEMTQAAAKMEKINRDIKFSDIMDYDPEIHNWYIPGLWHGVPPMASVNRGYSEKVFELKKFLFEFLRDRSVKKSPKDIPQFIEWMKSLWNAVKHENFIFSFRNSLIAEAYNQLSTKYSEWDWAFRREMHLWVSEQETLIQNASPDELDRLNWQHELQQKLLCGEQQILEYLNQYFEGGASNLHLVEKYREDFVRSANSLKHELENYSYSKCKDAIHIKKGRYKIDTLQMEYLKVIEGKVDRLLEECRKEERRLDDQELRREFERMWTETLSEISPVSLERRQIYSDIERCLRKDLFHRGSSVNLKVQEAKSLLNYRMNTFQMKSEYINSSSLWYNVKHMFSKKEHSRRTEEAANSLMSKCCLFIDEKVNSRGDYDETYCVELLHIINHMLQESEVQKLHTSPSFEVDLKLHILGEAAHIFQEKHEDFIKENDPQVRLEKLKPKYFSIFRNHYLERDAQQNRAKDFCDQCLHPALVDYVNKRLGIEIVDDILNSTQSIGYASRSFFQFTVLKELLEDRNVDDYVQYNTAYEKFVKSWIMRQILGHYADEQSLKNLEKDILSAIVKKIREMVENLKHKCFKKISEFLEFFCKEMQKELVISKDSLVGIQFKNMSDPGQFSVCVENFLPDLEKQILSEFDDQDLESKLSKLPVKPQDEIFKRVFGCGKQCPFCKVPCEAGGSAHKEHFATVHRPEGLGTFRWEKTGKLVYELCSTLVVSQCRFRTAETKWDYHPFKDYRVIYPDWCIQPDPSINASDYWKFVFKEFNHEFADQYDAEPADLPEDWKNITQEEALEALKETYNMK